MACRAVAFILVVVATLCTACGDGAVPGCDPDATCHADTSTSTTQGDGSTTTATGTTVTTTATTTAADTGEESTTSTAESSEGGGTTQTEGGDDSSSAATTGGGDTTESSTGDPGDAVYSAVAIVGALDRVRIFKHDLPSDRCTWITLVSPQGGGEYDVTTPAGWSVESIRISDVGDACGADSPDMFGAENATSAMGTVSFGDEPQPFPCLVSVDLEATFAGFLPGIPPSDAMIAADIPVEGC